MQRERLTITLDNELLTAVDATVDHSAIRNRSHAIEHLIRTGLSLHLMRQAFLVVREGWDSSTLPRIITLCEKLGITQYYLVPDESTSPLTSELSASLTQLSHGAHAQVVAGDFGSGGALTLLKHDITHDFLIINLQETLGLPSSLLPAYSHHLKSNGVITHILTPEDDGKFSPSGFTFAKPSLQEHVSAGYVSLEENVFPVLLKEGTVVGYVST